MMGVCEHVTTPGKLGLALAVAGQVCFFVSTSTLHLLSDTEAGRDVGTWGYCLHKYQAWNNTETRCSFSLDPFVTTPAWFRASQALSIVNQLCMLMCLGFFLRFACHRPKSCCGKQNLFVSTLGGFITMLVTFTVASVVGGGVNATSGASLGWGFSLIVVAGFFFLVADFLIFIEHVRQQ